MQDSSIKLFIENCCKVTTFEEDLVEICDFQDQYKDFCVLNGMAEEEINEPELEE